MKSSLGTFCLIIAAAVLGFNACDIHMNPSQSSNDAPLSLSATVVGGAPADAPAFAAQSKRITFGAQDVTLTSVKVVLAGVNLHGREVSADEKSGNDGKKEPQGKPAQEDMYDDGMHRNDSLDQDRRTLNEADIDFAGPYVLELMTNTFTPSLSDVTVPAGKYNSVDLTFQVLSAAAAVEMGLDASDAVVGHSYMIEGYLSHATVPSVVTDATVKLVIFGDQDKTYKVNLKKGIPVVAGNLNSLLLVFNADGWMPSSLVGQLRSGLESGSLSVDTSEGAPVLYLDASRNSSIAAQFHKLFQANLRIAKDRNHDRMLSADEEAEDLPSAQ